MKVPKRKITNFPPLRSFCARKNVAFVVFCSLVFVLLVGFGLICVFVRSKSFRKKNNKPAWNCPNNLIYYNTDVYPYQPTENLFVRTYFYFWSSVRISSFYENLFESFLSVKISFYCENLLESLSFVWIYIFMKISKRMNTII